MQICHKTLELTKSTVGQTGNRPASGQCPKSRPEDRSKFTAKSVSQEPLRLDQLVDCIANSSLFLRPCGRSINHNAIRRQSQSEKCLALQFGARTVLAFEPTATFKATLCECNAAHSAAQHKHIAQSITDHYSICNYKAQGCQL